MATTILDVAKLSGFSKSTVSRCFLSPENVPEATRMHVFEAARVLNYTPNAIARAMARQKTDNISFIIAGDQYPASLNPFYSPVLEGVVQTARKHGYSLFVSSDAELCSPTGEFTLKKQMDGVIIAGCVDQQLVVGLINQNIPVVIVNQQTSINDVYCVISDHYDGARQAVEYFIKNGHRHIGLLAGKFSPQIYSARYNAYIDVLKKNNIPIKPFYIQTVDAQIEPVKRHVSAMLSLPNRPTALFCTNDIIAVGAIKASHHLGLRVPEDVAIIGFDDGPICLMMEPEIASVRIDSFAMGQIAAQILLDLIQKKDVPERIIYFPAKLILRESAQSGKENIV